MKTFIMKYKKEILILSILNLITYIFILINPILLQYIIDNVIMNNEKKLFNLILIILICPMLYLLLHHFYQIIILNM